MSSFDLSTFETNKNSFETNLDKFESTFANYDMTDASYISLTNIDIGSTFEANDSSNCRAICDGNDNCLAYSKVSDSSCNIYTSISDISERTEENNIFIKNSQISSLQTYLSSKNGTLKGIAESINTDHEQYTDYNPENTDKNNFDSNFAAFEEKLESKQQALVDQDSLTNDLKVNTNYFRYLFLLVFCWLLFGTFAYFMIHSAASSSGALYLVLFALSLAIYAMYFLQ